MVRPLSILPILLGTRVLSVLCGSCFSDQSEDVEPAPTVPTVPRKPCLNTPPDGQLWACEDPSIDFPTVECLLADVKTCGIIGSAPTLLYSFGADKEHSQEYRLQAEPSGNLYDDMLDDVYWTRVMVGRRETFRTDIVARNNVLIARSAEALCLASSGEVLVFVGQRQGKDGVGAFQLPIPDAKNPDAPNILRTYELPALQRNPAVTRITSIDISNNFQRDVDWENGQSAPGLNNVLLPAGQADSIPVPPVPAGLENVRRDSSVTTPDDEVPSLCPVIAAAADATPTPGSTSSAPASLITSMAAKPSCVLHEQDPDQGITQAFCLCDSTATLSPLSVPATGHQSDSCAYTTMPTTGQETVTTLASTYTKNCQGCTQVGFNAPSCTTVPQCTPTSAEVTVQAGSSPVLVGTLTGTALYTSVSSALEKLCPSVTQTQSSTACETGSATIPNIQYVNDGGLDTGGELVIKVAASSYNSTGLRDAMIKSAALTAQKGSEQKSSCTNQTYTTLVKKREPDPRPLSRIFGRRRINDLLFAGYARDRPQLVEQKALVCNTAAFAGVGYFSAEWRKEQNPGAEAYLDATWDFKADPAGDFLCDFIEDLELGLAIVAPEFAAEDLATIPEIQAFCGGTLDK